MLVTHWQASVIRLSWAQTCHMLAPGLYMPLPFCSSLMTLPAISEIPAVTACCMTQYSSCSASYRQASSVYQSRLPRSPSCTCWTYSTCCVDLLVVWHTTLAVVHSKKKWMTIDIPDWLRFFPFLGWSGNVLSSSVFYWFDEVFPVQPHERGIPWLIQLYFCQSVPPAGSKAVFTSPGSPADLQDLQTSPADLLFYCAYSIYRRPRHLFY